MLKRIWGWIVTLGRKPEPEPKARDYLAYLGTKEREVMEQRRARALHISSTRRIIVQGGEEA